MSERKTRAAWWYHNGTKHPNGRLMNPSHVYDPSLRPMSFKVYEHLDPIPLSIDKTARGTPALDAIASTVSPAGERVPDVDTLARLLYFSAGITKRIKLGRSGERYPFRAASCTGALYHIELYVVCGDVPGLDAGVYHFDVREEALRQLRAGDYRRVLVEASGNHPHVAQAPAVLVATDYPWRNAVKYQAREYRHAFWDSGTILANTLAIAAGEDMPAMVVAGFVDAAVNRLLDLDIEREFALELVPIGHAPDMAVGPSPDMPPLDLETEPVSSYERKFPAILEIHAASALDDDDDVAVWRSAVPDLSLPAPTGDLIPLEPFGEDEMPADPIEDVIQRRGSTRRYSAESITFHQLSTILTRATGEVPADFPTLNHIYVIVNEVDGLAAGTYVFHRDRQALELLAAGDVAGQAGQLALGQALGADAAVNVYFLTDLDAVLAGYGDRGYRVAQLDASITAGRIYLAAYALALGATGLTFYDDAVTRFFSPHADGKSVTFLMTVGMPAY